jgi:ribosomal protein S18 acetylase RimI-like enzyme
MTPATAVRLRRAVPDDAAEMAAVMVAAWHHAYPGIVADDVIAAQTVQRWEPVLAAAVAPGAAPDTGAVVAVDGADHVVAFAGFRPDPDDRRLGHLASLYVDPAAAGRGIGRRLVERTLAELASTGRRTVTLWVFRDNARARELYERCGFRADGTELVDLRWRVPQVRYRFTPLAPAPPTEPRTPAEPAGRAEPAADGGDGSRAT